MELDDLVGKSVTKVEKDGGIVVLHLTENFKVLAYEAAFLNSVDEFGSPVVLRNGTTSPCLVCGSPSVGRLCPGCCFDDSIGG